MVTESGIYFVEHIEHAFGGIIANCFGWTIATSFGGMIASSFGGITVKSLFGVFIRLWHPFEAKSKQTVSLFKIKKIEKLFISANKRFQFFSLLLHI